MAILLGEGDELQCILVVVVERFQSETIDTFTSSGFTFAVKCKVNYTLQHTLEHIGQNTNYKTCYNTVTGNVKCTVQLTVMHKVQASVRTAHINDQNTVKLE